MKGLTQKPTIYMLTTTKVRHSRAGGNLYRFLIRLGMTIAFFFIFSSSCFASQVVINEFLPNPSGDENQDEWVELYNSGGDKDISGWAFYDASDHELVIDVSKTNTGNTIINSNSWLVIYRRGASFSLNNSNAETIRLYNDQISTSSAELIDSVSYNGSSEEKTWGKIPDGGSNWISGLNKTPGSANQGLASPDPSPSPSPSFSPEPENEESNSSDTVLPSPSPKAITTTTKKASPKPSPSPKDEEEKQVLGEDTNHRENQEEENKDEEKEDKKFRLSLPVIISGLGALLLLAASFPFLKPKIVPLLGKIKLRKRKRRFPNT